MMFLSKIRISKSMFPHFPTLRSPLIMGFTPYTVVTPSDTVGSRVVGCTDANKLQSEASNSKKDAKWPTQTELHSTVLDTISCRSSHDMYAVICTQQHYIAFSNKKLLLVSGRFPDRLFNDLLAAMYYPPNQMNIFTRCRRRFVFLFTIEFRFFQCLYCVLMTSLPEIASFLWCMLPRCNWNVFLYSLL